MSVKDQSDIAAVLAQFWHESMCDLFRRRAPILPVLPGSCRPAGWQVACGGVGGGASGFARAWCAAWARRSESINRFFASHDPPSPVPPYDPHHRWSVGAGGVAEPRPAFPHARRSPLLRHCYHIAMK